jgi:hypothetical protein
MKTLLAAALTSAVLSTSAFAVQVASPDFAARESKVRVGAAPLDLLPLLPPHARAAVPNDLPPLLPPHALADAVPNDLVPLLPPHALADAVPNDLVPLLPPHFVAFGRSL